MLYFIFEEEEEKEERNMTRKMEIWTSEASGDEQERERKEMSWAEQVDLAYPLEECEFRMQTEYS